jgi:hypothetical protein
MTVSHFGCDAYDFTLFCAREIVLHK